MAEFVTSNVDHFLLSLKQKLNSLLISFVNSLVEQSNAAGRLTQIFWVKTAADWKDLPPKESTEIKSKGKRQAITNLNWGAAKNLFVAVVCLKKSLVLQKKNCSKIFLQATYRMQESHDTWKLVSKTCLPVLASPLSYIWAGLWMLPLSFHNFSVFYRFSIFIEWHLH